MSERKRNAAFAGRGSTAGPGTPLAQGLYDPALDKDSCGVGFIADIKGRKSHQLIEDGLRILCNLEHRGAVGADPRMGDGAGILVQIPHKFFARKAQDDRQAPVAIVGRKVTVARVAVGRRGAAATVRAIVEPPAPG